MIIDRRGFVALGGAFVSASGFYANAALSDQKNALFIAYDVTLSATQPLLSASKNKSAILLPFETDPTDLWYGELSKICQSGKGTLVLAAKPSIAFQLSQLAIDLGYRPLEVETPHKPRDLDIRILEKPDSFSAPPKAWS